MTCTDHPPAARDRAAAEIEALADVLVDCVEGGASVSFMLPLTRPRRRAFWQRVADGVARGERALLVAEDAAGIVGTVQLISSCPRTSRIARTSPRCWSTAARGGRASARRCCAPPSAARDRGRTLLVLDTASAEAERLYARAGWQRCGVIPATR